MVNDSQEETPNLNEEELEALIDQVEQKYFWTEEDCIAWMEAQHERI